MIPRPTFASVLALLLITHGLTTAANAQANSSCGSAGSKPAVKAEDLVGLYSKRWKNPNAGAEQAGIQPGGEDLLGISIENGRIKIWLKSVGPGLGHECNLANIAELCGDALLVVPTPDEAIYLKLKDLKPPVLRIKGDALEFDRSADGNIYSGGGTPYCGSRGNFGGPFPFAGKRPFSKRRFEN